MNNRKTLSKLAGMIFLSSASKRARRLALGSFLLAALFASAAEAQQRTFVSGLGNDTNPCTRSSPCRTIAQALSLTVAGGEVVVLDSAGYGPFTITQAVTVQAPPGVYAGISVFSGAGITVNAGVTDTVILRGLTVNNQGSNGDGIFAFAGGTLHVESCVVNGFSSGSGVDFSNPGTLEVKDSILRGNSTGIFVGPPSGTAQAEIDHVSMNDNTGDGLDVLGGSKVTIRDSVASGNGNNGFSVICSGATSAELNVEGCVVSSNTLGIVSTSSSTGVATVRVSNSTITNNSEGLHNSGSPAVFLSRGNNTVEGNTTNTDGTIGSYGAK